MKYPLTTAGIEPATFRFVVQRRNHCAAAVANQEIVVQFSEEAISFFYSKSSRLPVGPNQLSITWEIGALYPRVKR